MSCHSNRRVIFHRKRLSAPAVRIRSDQLLRAVWDLILCSVYHKSFQKSIDKFNVVCDLPLINAVLISAFY